MVAEWLGSRPARSAVGLALCGGLLACSTTPNSGEGPPRPASMPAEASWCGGVDGGVWFACAALGSTTAHCDVFDDLGGRLESGVYELRAGRPRRGAPIGDLDWGEGCQGYDGEVLYLSEDRLLCPLARSEQAAGGGE